MVTPNGPNNHPEGAFANMGTLTGIVWHLELLYRSWWPSLMRPASGRLALYRCHLLERLRQEAILPVPDWRRPFKRNGRVLSRLQLSILTSLRIPPMTVAGKGDGR